MTSISVLVGRRVRTKVIVSVSHVYVSADDKIAPVCVHGSVMSHYELVRIHNTHKVYKVMSALAVDVIARAMISFRPC